MNCITILGDNYCGKTNFINGKYNNGIKTTLGIDVFEKIIDNKKYFLFDIASSHYYLNYHKKYLDNKYFIVCFSLNNINSLKNVKKWLEYIDYNKKNGDNKKVVIVGLKSDIKNIDDQTILKICGKCYMVSIKNDNSNDIISSIIYNLVNE